MLNFSSAQKKFVKQGIATTCLSKTWQKSYLHAIDQSFGHYVTRLKVEGYSDAIMRRVSEKTLHEKGMAGLNRINKLGQSVVIP